MVGDIMFMDLLFVLGGSTYRRISRLNEKKNVVTKHSVIKSKIMT